MKRLTPRRRAAVVLAVALGAFATVLVGGASLASASHVDSFGNPLPHATLKLWDTTSTLGFNPDESVEDIAGLSGHASNAGDVFAGAVTVGAPAIVTVYENTTHPGGPCGIAFWNPDTSAFVWYGVTGGFQAAVDLDRSAPTLIGAGGAVFGPGDAWASGPTGQPIYVVFAGTNSFRGYFVSSPFGVEVDQTTGKVFFASLVGDIGLLDPVTNTQTLWSVGGTPRYVTKDSAGRVYATVEGLDQIVRVDPATNEVKRWTVPGAGSLAGFGETPDGITIDSAGRVWFAESGSSEIGKLDPSTDVITEYFKPGVSVPQLVASSGSGDKLQTFFTEFSTTAVSIVTQKEAIGVSTTVAPTVTTVTPSASTVFTDDFTREPRSAIITPSTFTIDGLDGVADAFGTTKTSAGERIPGILRFPFPVGSGASGMTGVYASGTVAGSLFFSNHVYQLTSGAIIAPPPPPPGDPPITATGTSISAVEGASFTGTVATFTDPDTPPPTASEYTATIAWGDSSSSAGTISGPTGGPFTVSGSHTYAEEGTYTVTVTVVDVDTPSDTATATTTATVGDAALSATCAAPSLSGTSFSGAVASLSDANTGAPASDFTATIDWGDSSSSAGIVSGSGGSYTVSGSHSYSSTGTFTITTSISDVGGSIASATCKILVFAFAPGGGAFVVGNLSASGSVTFWGAQWWKVNSLSGGAAPASFKGFAKSPSTPSCGTGWTTSTGNSPPPPAPPLPAFMAVIVASSVTQSGSTISGNTPHLVVVLTNAGYDANPGHAGTGTVVATIC